MKALQVTAPGTFAVTDVAPVTPGDCEVAITVRAVGICGTDIEIIDGTMAYYTSGQAHYPIVIGHEWVGEVAALGSGVSDFSKGDRVVGEVSIGCMVCDVCRSGAYHRCPRRTETGVMNRSGGMAEQVVLPAWAVHRINPSVDLRAAALVEPTAVALNAVRLAALKPTDSVVVIGDGPIGLLLLQVAKAKGAERVILIGANDRRLALAATFGPLDVIDARSGDAVSRVRRYYPALADVVLEASGTSAGVETAMAVAAPGARIILQGLLGRMPERPLSLDNIVIGDMTIRGALGSPGIWPEAISLIESGKVDPALLVTHDVPLTAFSEALAAVRSRQAVKAVVRPDEV
jgi:L-iditol 2-dehydrogenase